MFKNQIIFHAFYAYYMLVIIIKIDSMNWSFCRCHILQNGLSYLGEEMPTRR